MAVESPPHFLCVFRGDPTVTDDVRDTGFDPDFRTPVATWGICRPMTRRSVRPGSHVVFLGYYPDNQRYLIKGWLRVGEKLGYLEALGRFGRRANVIVRDGQDVDQRAVERGWKRIALRDDTIRRYATDAPSFLSTIHVAGRTLVQSPADAHEIDNWKCQRMFLCRAQQLGRCIAAGNCVREPEFPHLRGYIVAAEDGWRDVGPLRLDWFAVAPRDLRNRTLRTPYGQHNALRITDDDVECIIDALTGIGS